jgi:hypothetical protein
LPLQVCIVLPTNVGWLNKARQQLFVKRGVGDAVSKD